MDMFHNNPSIIWANQRAIHKNEAVEGALMEKVSLFGGRVQVSVMFSGITYPIFKRQPYTDPYCILLTIMFKGGQNGKKPTLLKVGSVSDLCWNLVVKLASPSLMVAAKSVSFWLTG